MKSSKIMSNFHDGVDSLLSRTVQIVAEAQRSRAPHPRAADKVAGIFAPPVAAAAMTTFLIRYFFDPALRL